MPHVPDHEQPVPTPRRPIRGVPTRALGGTQGKPLEDASVSNRVTGLITADSPFIQRAKTDARKASARRGLLNSSIAVQAGEEAAQKAALPIASQEASQIHQRNLSAQSAAQTSQLQQDRFQQETAESIAQRAFQSSEASLSRTSQENLATQEIEARRGLLSTELESREREGVAIREAARFSQEQRIEADRSLQERGIIANETIAQLNADTRVELSNLSNQSQEAIAAMNIQSGERQRATEALIHFSSQYENAFSAITNNTNIPAGYRDAALEHLALIRDSNFAMVEQLHNVDIAWSTISTPDIGAPPLQPIGPPLSQQVTNINPTTPGDLPDFQSDR